MCTRTNPAYEEDEEEDDESVVSVTPTGSTEALTRGRAPAAKPPPASRKTSAKPQRPVEPPAEMESDEDSELSEDASESEPESVQPPQQVTMRNQTLDKCEQIVQSSTYLCICWVGWQLSSNLALMAH